MIGDSARRDDTTGVLSLLTTHEPDLLRAARVRVRCHAALQARTRMTPPRAWESWRHALEPAIVGCLCAGYLFEVLSRALQLYRF